jgi:hypothetical protein
MGPVVDPGAGLVGVREVLKFELPHLAGGRDDQSCSYRAMQLLLGKNKSSDHLAWTGSELPRTPFATCPVDKRNQILLTSQSPGENTSECLLVMDSQ